MIGVIQVSPYIVVLTGNPSIEEWSKLTIGQDGSLSILEAIWASFSASEFDAWGIGYLKRIKV